MPNQFGGSQLDPEYAPWAKTKLTAKQRDNIAKLKLAEAKIRRLETQIEPLQNWLDELKKEVKRRQGKCPHHNRTTRGESMKIVEVCVDCGKGFTS